MCVYICVYVYMCLCVCIYVCASACMCTCACVYVFVRTLGVICIIWNNQIICLALLLPHIVNRDVTEEQLEEILDNPDTPIFTQDVSVKYDTLIKPSCLPSL